MRGIAVIGGGSFNNASLPKINIKSVPVIQGARYDWAADNVALGSTQQWWDQVRAGRLVAPDDSTRWPVNTAGTNRFLSFDGANDFLEADVDLTGEKTVVLVARFPDPVANQFMLTGGIGAGPHNFYTNADGNYAFNNGGVVASTKAADVFWHCFIITTKGNGSVLHIDGQEWTANLPASAATKLRLGATGSASFKAHVSRLAVLPYAADVHERAAIRSVMKAHYSLF